MRLRGWILVIATAGWVAVGAVPAFAQGDYTGPAGMIGEETTEPKSGQALNIQASLVAVYDSDMSADTRAPISQHMGSESIGRNGQLLTKTRYQWTGRDLQLHASTTSSDRYDVETEARSHIGHSAAAGLTLAVHRRTKLVVNHSSSYSPAYLYYLFPRDSSSLPRTGEAPTTAPDYRASTAESTSFHTEVLISHALTRRSTFTLSGETDITHSSTTPMGDFEQRLWGLSGRFTRQMTRNTTAVGRFGIGQGNLPSGAEPFTGVVDQSYAAIGFTHTRRLSPTRGLSVDALVGSALLSPAAGSMTRAPQYAQYRLVGEFGGRYKFARAWQAVASYQRGVNYLPGIPEPVSTGGVTARVEGLITYRLDATVQTGYVVGEPALTGGQGFDTYTGSARVRFALSKQVAAYAEYLHYFYDFRNYPHLVLTAPTILERFGGRFGLTLFFSPLEN